MEDIPEGKALAPVFDDFCKDGEAWIGKASESDQERVHNVLDDYMVMRRAAREETHILTLNKVGIERD